MALSQRPISPRPTSSGLPSSRPMSSKPGSSNRFSRQSSYSNTSPYARPGLMGSSSSQRTSRPAPTGRTSPYEKPSPYVKKTQPSAPQKISPYSKPSPYSKQSTPSKQELTIPQSYGLTTLNKIIDKATNRYSPDVIKHKLTKKEREEMKKFFKETMLKSKTARVRSQGIRKPWKKFRKKRRLDLMYKRAAKTRRERTLYDIKDRFFSKIAGETPTPKKK